MDIAFRVGSAAVANFLSVLGCIFLLSQLLVLLKRKPNRLRVAAIGCVLGMASLVSMALSFEIVDGVIGHLAFPLIVISGIVGGPAAAVVTGFFAAIFRVAVGGHILFALVGIGAATLLGVGLARQGRNASQSDLAFTGAVVAGVSALLPLSGAPLGVLSFDEAARAAAIVFAAGLAFYPYVILLVGRLLINELRRIDAETELVKQNIELVEQDRRFQDVFDLSSVAMAWSDLKSGRIIRVNEELARFTGYSKPELLAMTLDELAHGEDRDADRELAADLAAGCARSVTEERKVLAKDGAVLWASRTMTAVDDGGAPSLAFTLIKDITRRKHSEEQISYLATHDHLTGLANRREFGAAIDAALASGRCFAVICLDLDGFKSVNDTLGHHAGDAVLNQVADRLRTWADETDVVSRSGGDEFAVLKLCDQRDHTHEIARSLLAALNRLYEVDGQPTSITASAGVSVAGEHGNTAAALLKRADIALYRAKGDGEGKFQVFAPDMERAAAERLLMKRALAEALPRGELELDYQPIIDLKTGRVGSAEALLRWRHPERGRIPPTEFIPIAERIGLIASIGAWVLEEACRSARHWPGRPCVAVNVSAVQFTSCFPANVAAILGRTGFEPDRLVIEITESVLVQDTEENLAILNSLKELGVKIALDDFGTGYSSLAYLSRFPFDVLKMDRGFIGDNTTREKSLAIVRAVAHLGHMLGMRVTAEGVETEEQLARVKRDGCDYAQGYFFSRPLREGDLIAMLAEPLRPAPVLAVAAGA